MRTLVIPDVHQRIGRIDKALNKEGYDETIFLGDWFDTFAKPPYVATISETASYLKDLILKHPRRNSFIFLLGNHDLSYIYHNKLNSKEKLGIFDSHGFIYDPTYYCPGFEENKSQEFREVFFDQGHKDDFFLKTFKIAHHCKYHNITFSHAGIIPEHLLQPKKLLNPHKKILSDFNTKGYLLCELLNSIFQLLSSTHTPIEKFVNSELPEVWSNFRDLEHCNNKLLSNIGNCRGGNSPYGGILWLDAYEEFYASPHTGKQIFGHSVGKNPRVFSPSTKYESWCLDTAKHYGILEDGELTIKEYNGLY